MAPRKKPPSTFREHPERINRKGRPKVGLTIAEQIRDALNEPVEEGGAYRKLDKIIDKAVAQAIAGDRHARQWLANRGYGKLLDHIEMTQGQPFDASKLSDDELATLKVLLQKGKRE